MSTSNGIFGYFTGNSAAQAKPASNETAKRKETLEELETKVKGMRFDIVNVQRELEEGKESNQKLEKELSKSKSQFKWIEKNRSTIGDSFFELRAELNVIEEKKYEIEKEIQHQLAIYDEYNNESEELKLALLNTRSESEQLKTFNGIMLTLVNRLENHKREMTKIKDKEEYDKKDTSIEADKLRASLKGLTELRDNIRDALTQCQNDKDKVKACAQNLEFENYELHEMLDTSEVEKRVSMNHTGNLRRPVRTSINTVDSSGWGY